MIQKLQKRMMSDAGDSLSTSQILWIAMTAVLVLSVGVMIFRAVNSKGHQVADMMNGAGDVGGDFWTSEDKIVPNN